MKNRIILASLLLGSLAYGQIKVHTGLDTSIGNENPFLDASAYNNFNNNVGKGLYFPTTDLTTWEFKTNAINPGKFKNYFDGMIVYNSGTGKTLEDASKGGKQVSVTPGFYYFKNPNQTAPSGSVANGEWVRISDAASNDNIWTNDHTNSLAKLKNLSDGTTPRTDDKNVFINDEGAVIIGESTTIDPNSKLEVAGEIMRVYGAGNEKAYIGGDGVEPFEGAGVDVQLGSTTPGVKEVSLWNAKDRFVMNLNAADIRARKIGIGTNNPTEKLELKGGHIKIDDGTQQEGRVLTSDANGVGTWQALSIGNKMTQILFKNNDLSIVTKNYRIRTNDDYTNEVATEVSSPYNEIGLTYDNNKINLPRGKYMFYISHDINNSEYCNLQVIDNNKAEGQNVLYATFYGEWLNSSFPAILNKDTSISFRIRCFADDTYTPGGTTVGSPNPSPTFYKSEASYQHSILNNKVTILKLN